MALVVKNLNKSFPIHSPILFRHVGDVHAVRNVSFELPDQGSLGIVGESGSGKTTLTKILAGFIEADRGTAEFQNKDLITMSRRDRSNLVQMVFQDPFASVNPKLVLKTQLREALKVPSESKMAELMMSVGLQPDYLERYPHQLSGGQRQRFALARVLAREPQLLIADEPVSSLDLTVQAQIIKLLNQLKKDCKFTFMMISHDLAVVAQLCESIAVMKNGELVEFGPTRQVIQNPSSAYTKQLLDAVPVV